MSANAMSAEDRRLAKHRAEQVLEDIKQQQEAELRNSARNDTSQQAQKITQSAQYTSQPAALYTVPIATQQVSGTQAMGVQLLERLGSMASQPVYTTGVVSRIPQPDQLRGGKKGMGAATKPPAASALKPAQVGVPTNGNRVSPIPSRSVYLPFSH